MIADTKANTTREASKKTAISVIVPVYKVEPYLRRCVDSILAQSYRDFELIMVDDGSPDRCGAICDEYAEQYSFIRVIHQENQGQAAARNHAVSLSRGEWIIFIDSDDFVELDYIAYLVSLQKKYNADIAIGGFRYLYEGEKKPERRMETEELCMGTVKALQRMNYTKGFGAVSWAKLYRRQLILNHPFPEGQIYEDLAVLYRIFADAETVAYGNRTIYYWIQREGSTMRSAFDNRQMAAIVATKAQIAFIENRLPDVLPSAKARHEAKIVELMPIALRSKGSLQSFNRLRKESKYFSDVIRDPNVKKTIKMRMCAVRLGFVISKMAFWLHEKMKKHLFDS